jgi:hypothetical protein
MSTATYTGIVHGRSVVLEDAPTPLPDGTRVLVTPFARAGHNGGTPGRHPSTASCHHRSRRGVGGHFGSGETTAFARSYILRTQALHGAELCHLCISSMPTPSATR